MFKADAINNAVNIALENFVEVVNLHMQVESFHYCSV